jgi:hypothetical protein
VTPDQLRFYLELAWRLPVALSALAFDILGLPLLLGIFVAAFCLLGYRCLMERMK